MDINPMDFLKPKSVSDLFPQYCDKCGSRFEKNDYEIVSQEGNKSVCRIQCHNCNNSFVMHFSSPMHGLTTSLKLPVSPTLSAQEVGKFSGVERIEKEELLDVYISLKEVSTMEDLNKLFNSFDSDQD